MTRGMRRLFFSCGFLFLSIPLARAAAPLMDDYGIERRFVKRALDHPVRLNDFLELQLKDMEQAFPSEKDGVNVLYAELYLSQRQRKRAFEYLGKVGRGSAHYPWACKVRAKYASDPAEKASAYRDYFAAVKEPPQDEADLREFVEDVVRYHKTLMNEGKIKAAEKVWKLLEKVPEESQINPRMLKFLSAQAILQAQDQLVAEKKPINKSAIAQAETILKELAWNVGDYPGTMAYPELAHAMVLQGQYDKAIKWVDDASNILKSMEKAVEKSFSPVAPGIFYIAEAKYHKAKAIRRSNPDGAKKLLTDALTQYYLLTTKYRGSPIHKEAAARFAEVKMVLEKVFKVEVDVENLSLEQEAIYTKAVSLYQNKQVSAAGDQFLKAAVANFRGPKAPDALKMAVVCLYKADRYLEAMAVADFMKDWYRSSEHTATALYNLGITLTKAAKSKDPKVAATMQEDAARVLRDFVRCDPKHEKAAWAAYRIATYAYDRGTELKKEKEALAAKGASTKELNEKIEAMQAAYLAAADDFNILTEHFPSSSYGIKAYHRLGWIYHMGGKGEEAVDSFLRYCEVQEEPKVEKVEAKYLAADRLMRMGREDDAIPHFEEILDWTREGGEFERDERTLRYRENSEGMLAWCFDMRYRKLLAELADVERQLEGGPAESGDAAPDGGEAAPDDGEAAPDDGEAAPDGGEAVTEEDSAEEDSAEEDGAAADAVAPALIKAELEAKKKELTAAADALWKQVVGRFRDFISRYPKSSSTPANIAKLGTLFLEKNQFDDAVRWLERLAADYPDSEAAKQGLMNLGRAYVEVGDWEKASASFSKLIPSLPEMPSANVSYLGGLLWRDPAAAHKEPGLAQEVVLAACEELVKRSENQSHADYTMLQPQRERALFRCGEVYAVAGKPGAAIEKFDRLLAEKKIKDQELEKQGIKTGESPYYFRILFYKGIAHRHESKKEYDKALRFFDEILTYVNPDKQPNTYYEAVLESGRTLLMQDDMASARKAAARFQQVVQFADAGNEAIAGWVEEAYYEAAKALSLVGESAAANEIRDEYREKFRSGKYRDQILNLPAQKYRPPPPAAPAQ